MLKVIRELIKAFWEYITSLRFSVHVVAACTGSYSLNPQTQAERGCQDCPHRNICVALTKEI